MQKKRKVRGRGESAWPNWSSMNAKTRTRPSYYDSTDTIHGRTDTQRACPLDIVRQEKHDNRKKQKNERPGAQSVLPHCIFLLLLLLPQPLLMVWAPPGAQLPAEHLTLLLQALEALRPAPKVLHHPLEGLLRRWWSTRCRWGRRRPSGPLGAAGRRRRRPDSSGFLEELFVLGQQQRV